MRSDDWKQYLQQVAFWVLIIVLGAMVLLNSWRGRKANGGRNGADESPEQILKRRYAKGEIDREAFQQILTDLKERLRRTIAMGELHYGFEKRLTGTT